MSEQQTSDAPTRKVPDSDPVVEIDVDGPPDNERAMDADDHGDACGEHPLSARIEAVLVSTDRPLPDKRLAELLGIGSSDATAAITQCVEQLNAQYTQTGRAFRIERVAKGWQVLTHADFGPLLMRLHTDRQQGKLSQAALETLSIIAYRQPIMRAEIEAIRGVAAGEVLRGLMERRLVRVAGRAEELGRPMLYGTTGEFLNVFGLAGIDDLPAVEGLRREPAYRPPKVEPHAEPASETPSTTEGDSAGAASGNDEATPEGEQSRDELELAEKPPQIAENSE